MKRPKLYTYLSRGLPFRLIPRLEWNGLLWKDKFGTPRCEREPAFNIWWFTFMLNVSLGDDQYWEQRLWVEEYHDGDEEKAKRNWGWVDFETKESTWIDY
jgi:hypothetical protein